MTDSEMARIDRQTSALLRRSYYSHITWRNETKPNIQSVLSSFTWPTAFRPIQIPRGPNAIQIDLHSDSLFETSEEEAPTKKSIECEKPASLVISIHPNGTVAFIASGCSTSFAKLDDRQFTIGLYRDAQSLAASAGCSLLIRLLQTFSRLAAISLTRRVPTWHDGRFIAKLQSRSLKYSSLYSTPQEAQRARQSQHVAFAGGLAGGLIASSIFPTLLAVGQSVGKQTIGVPILLRPVSVLLMAIVLAVISLGVIVRGMNRR